MRALSCPADHLAILFIMTEIKGTAISRLWLTCGRTMGLSTALKSRKKELDQTPRALLEADVMSKHVRAKALNPRIEPPPATVAPSHFGELELRKILESPGGSPEAQRNLLLMVHSARRSGVVEK